MTRAGKESIRFWCTGGGADQNPDPGFLNPDQGQDPEIFYCPARPIRLSVEDTKLVHRNCMSHIFCVVSENFGVVPYRP